MWLPRYMNFTTCLISSWLMNSWHLGDNISLRWPYFHFLIFICNPILLLPVTTLFIICWRSVWGEAILGWVHHMFRCSRLAPLKLQPSGCNSIINSATAFLGVGIYVRNVTRIPSSRNVCHTDLYPAGHPGLSSSCWNLLLAKSMWFNWICFLRGPYVFSLLFNVRKDMSTPWCFQSNIVIFSYSIPWSKW